MRIKITLSHSAQKYTLPINYSYMLSSVNYGFIRNSSEQFSEWLHDVGYIKDNKPFKLFTFSNMYFDQRIIKRNIIEAAGNCYYYFSAPLSKEIIEHFVQGIMVYPKVELNSRISNVYFNIETVQVLPEPIFKDEMRYIMLSPVTISTMCEYKGKTSIYYYRPDDPELEDALANNLKKKYELIHNKPYNDNIKVELDWSYINSKNGKVTKLITIKEGNPDEIRIKAFMCPLRIRAIPEMQQVAYDCGIGEKTSMGFGCLREKKSRELYN